VFPSLLRCSSDSFAFSPTLVSDKLSRTVTRQQAGGLRDGVSGQSQSHVATDGLGV
jgi:hypothetical protein